MVRLLTVIAFALALPSIVGCGETVIDSANLEETLRHSLETERDEKVASVDCPSDQEVVPKATFECTVELADGKTKAATIEIRNEQADVSVIRFGEEGQGSQ